MTLTEPPELHEAALANRIIKSLNVMIMRYWPLMQPNTNHKSIFQSRQVSRSVDRLGLLATWQLQSLGTKNVSELECSKTKDPTRHCSPDIKEINDYWDSGRGIETLGCVCLSLHRSARMFVSIT